MTDDTMHAEDVRCRRCAYSTSAWYLGVREYGCPVNSIAPQLPYFVNVPADEKCIRACESNSPVEFSTFKYKLYTVFIPGSLFVDRKRAVSPGVSPLPYAMTLYSTSD